MCKEEMKISISILETSGHIKNLFPFNILSLNQLRKRKNFLPLKWNDTSRILLPASEYLPIWNQQDLQDSDLTVYVLPEDNLAVHLSPRSRRRARALHLHPGQEFMRSSIARSLTPLPAPSRPECRFFKSLENIILGKK